MIGKEFSKIFFQSVPLPVEQIVRRLYNEGANKGLIGQREYEITPDNIINRSTHRMSYVAWAGVERIVSTENHTFIYIGAVEAFLIPRAELSEADYCAFVELAKNAWQKKCPTTE